MNNARFAELTSEATFSDDLRFRYTLTRIWNHDKLPLMVVMLNPSTADATINDPTITRCINRAVNALYGGIIVCNLYAYRSPSPAEMLREYNAGRDIVGPGNDDAIADVAELCDDALVAWGNHTLVPKREHVLDILYDADVRVSSLCLTTKGFPYHPLYVSYDTPMRPYAGRCAR